MLASLILQILLMTVVQTLMYEWTINQEWFCSISDNFPDCFERNDEGGILRALNVTERCPRDGTCISEVPHIDFTCDDKGSFQTFFRQNQLSKLQKILMKLNLGFQNDPKYHK